MSIKVIDDVVDHSQASGCARLVLLSLADHADRATKLAWPKHSTIADETRTSERTVRRAILHLAELGEVTIVSTGQGRACGCYMVHPDRNLPAVEKIEEAIRFYADLIRARKPVTMSTSNRTESPVQTGQDGQINRTGCPIQTGHPVPTRASNKGEPSLEPLENDAREIEEKPKTENRSHEAQGHNLEGDTEDSHISPASSMDVDGESKTLEPPPQNATDQTTPENQKHVIGYSKADQLGPGSDQEQRRKNREAGTKSPSTPASTTLGVPLTKKQAKKAWAKGEAEKWLARHTSTSNS